ncbi:hypothetical protein M747DRAFT_166425 [Aspergillus niger ATCC 13496]|uniref:Uncharacterized protein n=1 Tax=Aspergillus niger ATCC 13496 TaxID=1353008 RepID=A0A370C646_ASPNG|nr:hypothetical protein M747DRAFT_166425 [Aspergillus niger ATCC 13496]
MPMQKGVNKARTSERTDFEDLSDLTWSPSVGMGCAARRQTIDAGAREAAESRSATLLTRGPGFLTRHYNLVQFPWSFRLGLRME